MPQLKSLCPSPPPQNWNFSWTSDSNTSHYPNATYYPTLNFFGTSYVNASTQMESNKSSHPSPSPQNWDFSWTISTPRRLCCLPEGCLLVFFSFLKYYILLLTKVSFFQFGNSFRINLGNGRHKKKVLISHAEKISWNTVGFQLEQKEWIHDFKRTPHFLPLRNQFRFTSFLLSSCDVKIEPCDRNKEALSLLKDSATGVIWVCWLTTVEVDGQCWDWLPLTC